MNRFRIVLLALVAALACVVAPTAGAAQPASDSLALDLEIFDLATTTACGTDVFANVSGTIERHLYVTNEGSIDRQVETFRGTIAWFTRGTGKSYSAPTSTRIVIEFPQGVDLFNPVRITVTGTNGGVFPIFDGPAGSGQLVYDTRLRLLGERGRSALEERQLRQRVAADLRGARLTVRRGAGPTYASSPRRPPKTSIAAAVRVRTPSFS